MEFKTAAVIGTGMMGPGIAHSLAMGGLHTTILSRSMENAENARERARAWTFEEKGDENLIAASTDFDRVVASVDLIVESAPENLAFKQDLFARLDALSRPDCVLATNTSGLSITAVQSKCRYPQRTLTTHFWNPPHLMQLVEVICGAQTDPAVAASVRDLLIRCGKMPVLVKKDRPGQLGNRLQMALFREAMYCVQEGIADAADVDLCIMAGFGLRMPVYGALEHADMVGLELVQSLINYTLPDLYNEPHAPPILAEKIAAGATGVTAGKGFYDWTVKDAAAVRARRDAFVREFTRRHSSNREPAAAHTQTRSHV